MDLSSAILDDASWGDADLTGALWPGWHEIPKGWASVERMNKDGDSRLGRADTGG